MPDSKGISWSHGSLFKTLLDRDQYVTGLKNSSHWPDIYFGMAGAPPWIQNSWVRPQDLSTFHIFTSFKPRRLHMYLFIYFFTKSDAHELITFASVHSLQRLWCFFYGVKGKPQHVLICHSQTYFLQFVFPHSRTLGWLCVCIWILV